MMLSFGSAFGQGSAAFGNGLSAAATGRGSTTAAEIGSAMDAVQGNPAGLAGVTARTVDLSAIALVVGGSFSNVANANASPNGLAGALPYGAFAQPFGSGTRWVASAAVTPEALIRSNWHYVDAPGTAGVSYGSQKQESQIIAIRSSLGLARRLGSRWEAGVTLGIVYNQNNLDAPYIFQQQPALAGLKVLLNLSTRGYGWNGSAGLGWHPSAKVQAGVAWKSETSMRTTGTAVGSASALFAALASPSDPNYSYLAQIPIHLPQSWDAGIRWQATPGLAVAVEGDFTDWAQAFKQLPISLSNGSNLTINSIVGADSVSDEVPLSWRNQTAVHVGFEQRLGSNFMVRGGYSHQTDPVPSSTLTPLTAAILVNSLAAGGGWTRGRFHTDLAYQVQLPATQSVGQSGLLAGEYSHSTVRVWTQSVVISSQFHFGKKS